MSAPISRIGGQRAVTRRDGSDGHDKVAKQLDRPHGQPPRNEKVDQVAKMYERQFLSEMFKAMRSTVNETDKPSMAQEIYQGQRDEQYLDAWSEQGGIGFSNIIYDQIMEKFFGQTPQGAQLKKQGMIPLTNRDVARVSKVENGVATPVVPKAPSVAASFGEKPTVENTEPMPAPTRPSSDVRSREERLAAGELFPESAVNNPQPTIRTATGTDTATDAATDAAAGFASAVDSAVSKLPSQQTALQIEVRPSPTAGAARIQAPWDATVIRSVKLDGGRHAVTLEHGPGVRSTLVFDGVVGGRVKAGEKIPRGQTVGMLNADAKSFLWNLATTGQD